MITCNFTKTIIPPFCLFDVGRLDMHALLKIRVLIALVSFFLSSTALCCSDGHGWKDFSTISFTTGDTGNITLARFTNGIYATILDEKSKKEMYQLNIGLNLYRGLTASEQSGTSPFFMLDMPIGFVLSLLAQQFKHPCSIESSEKHFKHSGRMGGSELEVNGSARRVAASAIVFDFSAVERKERGAKISAAGRIEFDDLAPVPSDTDIAGWIISRGILNNPESILKPSQAVNTIKDLGVLAQEKPKK